MQRRYLVSSVGEVLWDVFPDGARFGGAPANVACHAASLGAESAMVSRVGRDELGEQALTALSDHGVGTQCVAVTAAFATGTVRVTLDASGKPTFAIGEDAAWDHLEPSAPLDELAGRSEAVCFGTLGQRNADSRQVIQQFVAATPATALRVLDVNLRPPFFDADVIRQSLESASVLKLSDEELEIVASAGHVTGNEDSMIAGLIDGFALRLVALTRGSRGATLITPDDRSDFGVAEVEVCDTVGAGDAFTAALIIGMLRNETLDDINRRACAVASYVCTQPGATPSLPTSLRFDSD